jgi:hypothetical protein
MAGREISYRTLIRAARPNLVFGDPFLYNLSSNSAMNGLAKL